MTFQFSLSFFKSFFSFFLFHFLSLFPLLLPLPVAVLSTDSVAIRSLIPNSLQLSAQLTPLVNVALVNGRIGFPLN